MEFVVIGISHNTVPISMLEKMTFPPDVLKKALLSAHKVENMDEVVILSTCNRTEIYAHGKIFKEAIVKWFADFHQIKENIVLPLMYAYNGRKALKHLLRVACGLDSLALGEAQILGQIKSSLVSAGESNTIKKHLQHIFQMAVSTARMIRNQTDIGKNAVSIAYAAICVAKQIFEDLSQKRVLLVGSGNTITLVAKYLKTQKIARVVIANRTLKNAIAVSKILESNYIPLSEAKECLSEFDLVISATASTSAIFSTTDFLHAIEKRKHTPMLVLDLAVPRDIDPQINNFSDIYYYSIDDIKTIIENNLSQRRKSAIIAEELIAVKAEIYQNELSCRKNIELIKSYRRQAEDLRSKEIKKALKRLALGDSPIEIIERLSKGLTNKLTHAPSAYIKRLNGTEHQEKIAVAQEMLSIKN